MNGIDDGWSASDDDASGNYDLSENARAGSDWTPDSEDGPGSAMGTSAQSRREQELARTIEAEIIPRLLLAHLASRNMTATREQTAAREQPEAIITGSLFTERKVAEFGKLVVQQPLRDATAYVDTLLAEGMTVETMILDVLSPTARWLGTCWEEDLLTFVDVTLGLSRLQQLLRVYGPAFEADFAPHRDGHRILLSAMPGEQHTFGMSVVEEFFRRDGWDVHSETSLTRVGLLKRCRDEWFDVVGLSASGDASVALLAPLIGSIRQVAPNKEVRVIVGGCAFLAEPANALALGADLVACNGKEAVLNVERLLNPYKGL